MTPLNNVSINTLDKSYNVFSALVDSKKTDKNNNEFENTNVNSINDDINYENKLEFATENEIINSQEELKNILDNVKNNIKSTNLSTIHQISLSNNVMNLLK